MCLMSQGDVIMALDATCVIDSRIRRTKSPDVLRGGPLSERVTRLAILISGPLSGGPLRDAVARSFLVFRFAGFQAWFRRGESASHSRTSTGLSQRVDAIAGGLGRRQSRFDGVAQLLHGGAAGRILAREISSEGISSHQSSSS